MQLLYLESTRSQHVDTDILSTNGVHQIVLDVLIPSTVTSNTSIVGSRGDSPTRRFGNLYMTGSPIHIGAYVGQSSNIMGYTPTIDERFTLDYIVDEPNQHFEMSINGISIGNDTYNGSAITGYPLFIFGANLNGNVTERSATRLYSCKMYIDGILVRDL